MGLEPTIFRFEVGRLIHWATRPILFMRFNMTSSKEKHQHLSEGVSTYNTTYVLPETWFHPLIFWS